MIKYKKIVVLVTIISMLFSSFAGAGVSYAASGAKDDSKSNIGEYNGKNLFDILLGLLLAPFLNKLFNNSDSNHKAPVLSKGARSEKEVLGFYAEWWGTDNSSYNSLVKNADSLKSIIPFWATLQADGSVTDRGGNDHAAIVDFARKNNIAALLLVNNAKDASGASALKKLLASHALREKSINNLLNYLKKYNLNGINIDFEMLTAADKENFSAFLRELAAKLKPNGYLVSVDVFPKTDENIDIAAAYDFNQINKHADKIIIMAYDNHGKWSAPGAIAPISWVEDVIKYALNFIPKEKLYLGVAGYGYDWSYNRVKSVEFNEINSIINKFNASLKWDDLTKSPYFIYKDNAGIEHTVWYENSQSARYKLDLVNKYNIAGIGLWKLGEEDPACWQLFKDKLVKKS